MPKIKYLFIMIVLVFLAGCDQELPAIKNGSIAPAFTLKKLNGSVLHFPGNYQGQVVALRFWADWCPYCHNEMKLLQPVYVQYRDQGLMIVAVNVMQSPETAQTFVEKLGISYDVLLDSKGEVIRLYRVMGLPVTYIIDRKGVVRSRIIGESTPQAFENVIRDLL